MKQKYFFRLLYIFVILAAFAEIGARFLVYLEKPTASYYSIADGKYLVAKKLQDWPHKNLVILLGDSLMTRAIFPEYVQYQLRNKGIEVNVLNLAVPGQTQEDAISMLKFILKYTKPSLVIYDYEPMNTNYFATGKYFRDLHSIPKDDFIIRCRMSHPTELYQKSRCEIESLSYLVRFRSHFKERIYSFLSTVFNTRYFEIQSMMELSDGALSVSILGSNPVFNTLPTQYLTERMPKYIEEFKRFGPRNSEFKYENYAYEELKKYTADEKIPLMFLWLPHLKSWYQEYFYQPPYDHSWYLKKFSELSSNQNIVYSVDLNKIDDNYLYYDDFRHLNAYGAVHASQLLSDTLSQDKFKIIITGAEK